jgi:hypothetical protein
MNINKCFFCFVCLFFSSGKLDSERSISNSLQFSRTSDNPNNIKTTTTTPSKQDKISVKTKQGKKIQDTKTTRQSQDETRQPQDKTEQDTGTRKDKRQDTT